MDSYFGGSDAPLPPVLAEQRRALDKQLRNLLTFVRAAKKNNKLSNETHQRFNGQLYALANKLFNVSSTGVPANKTHEPANQAHGPPTGAPNAGAPGGVDGVKQQNVQPNVVDGANKGEGERRTCNVCADEVPAAAMFRPGCTHNHEYCRACGVRFLRSKLGAANANSRELDAAAQCALCPPETGASLDGTCGIPPGKPCTRCDRARQTNAQGPGARPHGGHLLAPADVARLFGGAGLSAEDAALYARYQQMLAIRGVRVELRCLEAKLAGVGGIVQCPKCAAWVLVAGGAGAMTSRERRTTCTPCGTVFCAGCAHINAGAAGGGDAGGGGEGGGGEGE